MAVSPIITRRWRTGLHVGARKPTQTVEVQRGFMERDFGAFVMLSGKKENFGYISGGKHNADPWHGFWTATGDWIEVPNVSSVDTEQQFGVDGIGDPEVATILIENVVAKEVAGVAGMFHQIKRGFMAPWRGFRSNKDRPKDDDAEQNEWFDVLNGGYRIRVTQGYGDAMEPTFMGLIDDCDTRSDPDQITVTARNMGALLTDQRVFGWNKAKDVPSPITFADRSKAMKTEHAGANADASSTDPNHSSQNVLKDGSSQYWLSHGHDDPDHTEWVEIHLPKGRYSQFFIRPEYPGMEMFLSIFVHGTGNKIDGDPVPMGWIDTGLGDVPGAAGGFPYVKHWGAVDDQGMKRELPFTLDANDTATLRISFRKLGKSQGKGDYRARVSRLLAYRQTPNPKLLKNKHWILVDDPSDVVKWVLMWCGFHEWEVEEFGVPLAEPITFHQGDYFIDIIKHIVGQGMFTFFVDRPSNHPDSIGVPRFKRVQIGAPQKLQEVRDTDLLTGIETKFSKESLSFIIRVRGKALKASKGGKALGEDKTHRVQAVYFPPWSGAHHSVTTGLYQPHYPFADRLSGLRKHVVHWDKGVETQDEALMYCIEIAVQEMLASFTGQVEVPGYPGFRLNESISVLDTPSGTNSRLWISSRHSTFRTGPDGAWTMTLAGAMIDTPDAVALVRDYLALLKRVQVKREKK